MKPAHEPASRRPNPCVFFEKPHESCPFAAPCGPRRKKDDRGQTSVFTFKNLPVRAFDSRPQGFSPPLARRRSSFPPPSPNLVRTYPIKNYQAFHDRCSLPLACRHPPQGHQIGARKRRRHRNTILSRPYRRRISTDRPNREGSQLAASFEGGPALHPPERLSHTHTPKSGFGRRGHGILTTTLYFIDLETGIQQLIRIPDFFSFFKCAYDTILAQSVCVCRHTSNTIPNVTN